LQLIHNNAALHVAAVFVNNFTNHLKIGNEICDENQIRFPFYPLIIETAQIMNLPPALAQTGPAIRNDEKTIEAQQAFISDENN
jgi:hypothetical protein